jgi:subtilisin family serine protease
VEAVERTGGVLRRLGLVLAVLAGVLAMPTTVALAAPTDTTPAAPAAGGVSSPAAVAPEVEAKADTGDVKVIAVTDAPGTQVVDDVVAGLPEGSATGVKAGTGNHVALTVDAAGLDALRNSPAVTRIVEDKPNLPTTDPWLTTIGAPLAQFAGWNGTGRTVAILDTGVEASHPYLNGKVTAEACFSSSDANDQSVCPGQATAVEGPGTAAPCSVSSCYHGTHVAGIAAGGPVTSPTDLVGVAPSASIIAVQVFSEGLDPLVCGSGPTPCIVAYDSDIIAALDWLHTKVQANDPVFASLSAVNLSLGGGRGSSGPCDGIDPSMTASVNALRDLGVAVVAAAGNSGWVGAMASPACISTVVSVGATDGGGHRASYSNIDGYTSMLAPGSLIVSSVPGGSYGTLSGTSMATPVITAAIAEVRQRYPSSTVAQAVSLLRSTGDRINTEVGVMPELQIDNALADVPGTPNLAPGSPFGSVDSVSAVGVGSISFSGWAIDPDTAESIPVHVYVDGVVQGVTANGSRPDVNAAFGYGPLHGYSGTAPVSAGSHSVCIYAINAGVGTNVGLGCRTVTIMSGSPFGSVDSVSAGIGSISFSGWAIDPDTVSSIPVHVYVDGVVQALTADGSRPDVGAAFGYGALHGYSGSSSAAPGSHTVCIYAINTGAGSNAGLGCRTVTVPGGSPVGSLDVVSPGPGNVAVAGWALDPDTASSVTVHVYVDGTVNALPATGYRSDIASFFGPYGGTHGFSAVLPASAGPHTVCAYAINIGVGSNTGLGCRTVTVGGSPFGSLDYAVRTDSTHVAVGGWAIDPDTTASIPVHVYVNGVLQAAPAASGSRPDIGNAFAAYGPAHGFGTTVSGSAPIYVCAYAINVTGSDDNTPLGCRTL